MNTLQKITARKQAERALVRAQRAAYYTQVQAERHSHHSTAVFAIVRRTMANEGINLRDFVELGVEALTLPEVNEEVVKAATSLLIIEEVFVEDFPLIKPAGYLWSFSDAISIALSDSVGWSQTVARMNAMGFTPSSDSWDSPGLVSVNECDWDKK